jgi:hypothetical protein
MHLSVSTDQGISATAGCSSHALAFTAAKLQTSAKTSHCQTVLTKGFGKQTTLRAAWSAADHYGNHYSDRSLITTTAVSKPRTSAQLKRPKTDR